MLTWAGIGKISYGQGIALTLFAGIVWEYFAPVINPRAKTDPLDLVCYLAGAVIYYLCMHFIEKRKEKESNKI